MIRSWSWMVLWRLTRPSRTNNKKRCAFHHRERESKIRRSSNTWSNRQIWPWSTKWSRTKANRVLFCFFPQKNTPVIANTLSFNNTRDDSTHGHHQMVNTKIILITFFAPEDRQLYTVSKNKTRSWLWLRSWTSYCQIRLALKKVQKTTRPFRYDLNKIQWKWQIDSRD